MEFINHSPITKLNPSTIKWTIRARAQAVWKGVSRESKEFRGINILFVDDSRTRIHGFIATRLAPLFEKEVVEGEIYQLSNFIVQEYTGVEFNRCVHFGKHIFFAHYTKLEKCTTDRLTIPKVVVDLFSLEDLQSMEQDKRFLCDVCGVIKDPQDLRDYQNDNQEPKQQKKFTLTDGKTHVAVTLFDELAKTFDEALKKMDGKNNVVIISSAKIGRFLGDLCLTNYPATRIYLNPDHPAVKRLGKRSEKSNFFKEPEVVITQLEKVVINDMTIGDIKKMDQVGKVNCKVTMKKIQEDLNWFFYVCTKCNVELDMVDARYKCPECCRFFPWPQKRFRVFVLASDNTGALPFILGDREIRRLTGKMVFDVELDLTEEEPGKFPPVLKRLLNKDYVFTILLTEENIGKKSEVYEVCDVQTLGGLSTEPTPNLEEQSEEAEDHLNLQDLGVTTKSSKNVSEGKNVVANDDSDTNITKRIIKIKKEKNLIKEKKKTDQKPTTDSGPRKRGRKRIDIISESEDEEMTLNNYQLKNKKQGGKQIQ